MVAEAGPGLGPVVAVATACIERTREKPRKTFRDGAKCLRITDFGAERLVGSFGDGWTAAKATLAASNGEPSYGAADAHQRSQRDYSGCRQCPCPAGSGQVRLKRQCEEQGNAEVDYELQKKTEQVHKFAIRLIVGLEMKARGPVTLMSRTF